MASKRIPKELDNRRKLTDEQKEEIFRRYNDPNNTLSMEKLGQEYGVTKYTVYYIINPEKRKENSRKYNYMKNYSKEKHKMYTDKYKARLKELEQKGAVIDVTRDESSDTLQELIEKVQSFCEERDWDQFHNPKDLAIGISTEANELLDIFRFKSLEDIEELFRNPDKREHVEEEIADVLFFVLRFAQRNDIDLRSALEMKLQKNALKYTVEVSRGKNNKYNEL